MTDAHLQILGVIARGRARRLADHDRATDGARSLSVLKRSSLARQSDRAYSELARARRRREDVEHSVD
jgi:hypothetical protein